MSDSGFTGWRFDPKDSDRDWSDWSLMPPRALPDPGAAGPKPAVLFAWGVVGLGLLGVFEGSLAWLALRWAHTLGWLPDEPGRGPVVAIMVAVTYLRGFDRAVFRRQ